MLRFLQKTFYMRCVKNVNVVARVRKGSGEGDHTP